VAPQAGGGDSSISAYTDADWGSDLDDRRSISAYIIKGRVRGSQLEVEEADVRSSLFNGSGVCRPLPGCEGIGMDGGSFEGLGIEPQDAMRFLLTIRVPLLWQRTQYSTIGPSTL